ncbi:phage tail tip fiber protein [Sphingomonas oryzagri]
MVNQASTFDVTTERSAYDIRYNELKTYLESLVPAYTDLTQDTPIDAVADNNAWKGYWIAKQILEAALTGHAATTANWGDMVDDNGLLPEDGATKGAPSGTYVGSKPADDVAKDTDDSKNVITNLSDIIARELAKPLDDIASIALVQNTAHLKTTSIINGNLQEAYRTLTQTVTDQGDQISEDMLKLQTSVNNNTAAIQVINRTTSTNQEATAEQITLLTTRTDKTSTDLATEIQARANDKSAQLIVNQQLATSVQTETGARQSDISSVRSLISNIGAAQAQQIDQMEANLTTEGKTRQALEQTLRKVISDGDSSLAEQIETLSAGSDYSGDITDLNGKVDDLGNQIVEINATIQTNKQVAADDNQATANLVTNLQSTVGGFDARINQTESTLANLNGELESKYSLVVQTQSNGVLTVAGMELIATGAYSAVIFDADDFSIYTNNGTHQVFQATDSGIKMSNVAVDTLVANTIVATHIKADVLSGLWTWYGNDYLISPSTGEVNVMETEVIQVSDGVDGKGQLSIAFDLDALQYNDAGIMIRVYLDTGSGYSLARTRYAGIGTGHGDTFYRFPISFTVPIVTSSTVKVRVTCMANRLSEKFSTGGGACYVRSPEMTLVKWNR